MTQVNYYNDQGYKLNNSTLIQNCMRMAFQLFIQPSRKSYMYTSCSAMQSGYACATTMRLRTNVKGKCAYPKRCQKKKS